MRSNIQITMLAVLLAVFAVQAVGGIWNNAATYDEVAHLPAGYAYIRKGDFRFNPEHPPLVKMLAALPLLTMEIPPVEQNPHWNSNNEWLFGRYFLYHSGINADNAIFLGRLPMVLLGILLGFLVFKWSQEIYGTGAGLFSLFLFCFEPNVIASSQVIHTDLGFSLFLVLSLYLFWKAMQEPSRKRFILAGMSFGLALSTKFTALILIPVYLALILLYLFEDRAAFAFRRFLFRKEDRLTLRLRLYFALSSFALLLLTAMIVLIISYGFTSVGRYFDGLSFVLDHNRKGNPAFLFGMYSDSGWWYYFLLAFAVKTPIPVIIIFASALLSFGRDLFKNFKTPGNFYLLIPVLLLLFFTAAGRINIGLRHILPVYPLLFIFSGRLFSFIGSSTSKANSTSLIIIFALLLWLLGSAIFIFPHHLAYFDELAGGPSNGYKYLADSNLDWGQDLIRLKKFLQEEGEDSVILSYLGSADPNYYGIKYQYLPGYGLNSPQDYRIKFKRKEFVAISATNLQSVFFNTRDTFDWLKEKEPCARIGYSIFVWEISKDREAHRNLARLYREFGMPDLSKKHEKSAANEKEW
ncbi:MAG: phospholipid carrier-dependent glycosyltransferase [Acidobacteriota bacterium]